jgi:coronin-1B/1C/6
LFVYTGLALTFNAQEQSYDNLRISKNAWDTNLVKANPEYISVNWEASGGGAFAVIPINERGRVPEQIPLFRGHTAAVLDTDWYVWTNKGSMAALIGL